MKVLFMSDNRAYINLAIVKINWDRQQNSLADNFMPLIGSAIKSLEDDEISEVEIRRYVLEYFGFKIPYAAISTLLRKSSNDKYKYAEKRNGILYKNKSILSGIDFESQRRSAEESIKYVYEDFKKFLAEKFDDTTEIEANKDLFFSVLSKIAPSVVISSDDNTSRNDFEYKVASFISHSRNEDSKSFEYITSVVKGAIIAEFLYYSEPNFIERKMRDVFIFFDTRFILGLLGYTNDHDAESCRELLLILQGMEGKLKVFDITIEEISGILRAASIVARNGWKKDGQYRPGDAFDNFSRKGYSESDIELELTKLDSNIEAQGLRIIRTPSIIDKYTINYTGLTEVIRDTFQNQKEKAIDHDARCISSIFQIREGREFNSFEKCKAIFITTNWKLSSISNNFLKSEDYRSQIPVCMPSNVFTMIMWLKTIKRNEDLPREIIISNALAIMTPSEPLWRKYTAEAKKLKESGAINLVDYDILMSTFIAKDALMDITHGEDDAITSGSIIEILKKAKYEISSENQEALKVKENELERISKKQRRTTNKVEEISYKTIYASLVFIAVLPIIALFSVADPSKLFKPELSFDFIFSFSMLTITALSLVLGISLKSYIEEFCSAISKKLSIYFSELVYEKRD